METQETDPGREPAAEPTAEMTEAVYAAPDQITAELVRGTLESEGIPAVIGEQVADAYAGAFALGEGYWGEVRVAAADADRARAVLANYEQDQAPVSDAELTAQAEAATDPQV
jgi:hypothetical protein